jgi:hypothetical protein
MIDCSLSSNRYGSQMSAPDPLTDTYVAGLDLVAVQVGIGSAGAVIGRAPITEVKQLQSVFLYCKRHSNVDRMIASVRFQFANVPTRTTLSGIVSAVLKSADACGVSIMTETEVRMVAAEAIAEMETEVALLQSLRGPPAINRCVQNDAASTQASALPLSAVICWWLNSARSRTGASWRYYITVPAYRITTMIGLRIADLLSQFSRKASKLAQVCERLSLRLIENIPHGTGTELQSKRREGCSLLEHRGSQKRPNSEPFPPPTVDPVLSVRLKSSGVIGISCVSREAA